MNILGISAFYQDSTACIVRNDIDYVAFYEKFFLKFERLLETYVSFSPKDIKSFKMSMSVWLKKKLWIKDLIANELTFRNKIFFKRKKIKEYFL